MRNVRGNPEIGAPNLADNVWLYGDGGVFEIERTILYGVRTGNSKSRSVTDMPAFGKSVTMAAQRGLTKVQLDSAA